uniref:RNase H type-1 domain-containing protein n=1 Tax=Fagus sylvatica TaxID=28930 RepID=A0A2N9H4C7_FAGSY
MMRTKGKEDDKDTSEAEPEGHSNTNATPPRPPTPPKPEGKDSQLDSKIDSLEEKIRLIQGLNSFGNTDFSSMSWFPNMTVPPKFKAPEFEKYNGRGDPMIHLQMYCRKMAPYADNEPLLIQTFQDTLTGNAAECSGSVRPSKDGKEEQREPSGNMPKGGERKAARARPPLDEREMIKIFVDTLKNPYFDRMMGLQMQFFVDLIPVGERIEDALKTKKIVDMTALMALAEQAAKKAPTKRKEGDVQMIGRNNGRPRQVLPTFTMQPIQPRPIQAPAPTQVPAPAPAPQMPAKAELYPILIEKSLISPIVPKPYNGPQRRDFNPNSACDFHFGEVGHTVENCGQLRHRRKGTRRVSRGGVSSYTLEKQKHITPLDAPPGPSTGDACEYHSGARGHSLECCEEFKKKITNLMENGLVGREEIPSERKPSTRGSDEEADWGYFMEDDTDEWRDVDFTEFFQFPCLIVPPGFVTPEFEIFYEDGDPEVHLQKYGEKMALHLENELLMISVFPESLSKQAAAWFYQLRNLTGWDDLVRVFLERYRFNPHSILEYLGLKKDEEPYIIPDPGHWLRGEEEESIKTTTTKEPSNIITTAVAEEEYAGPMVEGLSIHTITEEEDSTTPPTRHCQQGEEANEGEEPREVKIGTRCAAEQKEALIALLREFHENLRLVLPRHARPRHRHSGPQDSFEARMQAREASTAPNEARTNIVPGAEKGRKSQNQRTSYSHSWTDSQGTIRSRWPKEDKSKTAFVTHWGTFVYDVMPFGLKNAGATYQRAMVTLFHDMIHHEIEVYVDDMIAKSRTAQDHLTDLRKLVPTTEEVSAPIESRTSVPSASHPEKKEIRSFLGRINYVARFIAQLTATCEPLFKLLRKDVKIKWTEDCQKAFDKIKEYLLNPPILVPPTPGRPLILYLTVQEASMGCMLGQQDETGKKEQAIYYLSKKFTEPETRYLLVEKTCCALGLGLQEAETVHALLHHLVGIPDGPDQAIKGQAIADYLADYPSEQWKLYFDGAANAVGSGIGAVLVSPKGQQTPIAVKLGFDCTNNMTEYEACIVGLQAALEFGAYELEVFGDSLLIVSQTNGEWQARDPKLIPYQRYISRLIPKFKYVTFTYTPRAHNHFADALATLASLIKLVEGDDVRPLRIETRDIPAYCVCIEECMNVEAEIDDKPWYYDIKRFIQDREYPSRATENEKKYIRRMAFQFFLSGEILYKRTHDATLLRCVDAEEANRLIQEMHAGLMGAHANGPFLARKIMRAGYYWLTMERDCIRHVQTCHKCQMYQNSKNAPPQYLHTMASPWPFSAWGMDVIGAITPKASNGHEFILVAIDYFTKWVEACSFKNVTQVAVTRYASSSRSSTTTLLHTVPKMNGAVEAANKNVKKILSKMTETYKDWHEHLPYALCAYRTSVRTSVGATPYSLVYGMEAVLPVEVEIPSLRILSQTQLEEAEWAQARYEQLNFIDEKRLAALCHGQLYQRRIERAYNKKARPRTFQPGDLVLKKRNMALSDPRGKFAPSYEGPYVVKKAFSGGAIILADMDGEEFRSPINSDSVIKYHV